MKFNTTYTSNTTLLETLIDIDEIKTLFIKFMKTKANFIEVNPPRFLLENDDKLFEVNDITRYVSFDISDEFRVGKLTLTDTNSLRELIQRTNLKKGQGFYSASTTIWRDVEENPTRSIARDEITFQFISEDSSSGFINNLSQDIYEFIFTLAKKYAKKYNHENIYPTFAEYASAQQLENEMPIQTPNIREQEFLTEKNAIIFRNPGHKLFSGNFHTYIHPSLYELRKYNQIFMKDRVNYDVLKVASIGVVASGKALEDQLIKYNKKYYLERKFFQYQVAFEKKIVEVKVNIPRLAMAVLAKGHISEVQAGTNNNEAKNIKKRYNINTI